MPNVEGKRVLDAGCGSGYYTEWLVHRGAEVVTLDVTPKMVELTRQRLGSRADVRLVDLDQPLDFLADGYFDLVLCPLVLDYLEDWEAIFAEFHRVLRRAGLFVFSVGHPMADYLYWNDSDYFATELVEAEWTSTLSNWFRSTNLVSMKAALLYQNHFDGALASANQQQSAVIDGRWAQYPHPFGKRAL